MNKYDFFVSYTKSDLEYADWLVFTLEAADYKCVYQARDFVPGESFMEQMRHASKESRTTIALLSPEYLESEFAQMELDGALAADPRGKNGRLLPILVRKCEPDPLLTTRVWIDLVGCDPSNAAKRLLSGVKASRIGVLRDNRGHFREPPSFPHQNEFLEVSKDSSKSVDEIHLTFLGADAGIVGLDLAAEAQAIQDVVPVELRNKVKIVTAFNVVADDFYTVLNDSRPQIVHFSGSFIKEGGMALNDGAGGFRKVDLDAAVGMFECFRDTVNLVVFSACYSAECARELASVVGVTIGIEGIIYDQDATAYSRAFYSALWRNRSIKEAHEQACSRINVNDVLTESIPKIFTGNGVDINKSIFGNGV